MIGEYGRVGLRSFGWGVWVGDETGSYWADGVFEVMKVLLDGIHWLLSEPLCIGRSLVRCVSGGMFPIPDPVAAALRVF